MDVERLREIAEMEFTDIVAEAFVPDINELRIILNDSSFVDVWFSIYSIRRREGNSHPEEEKEMKGLINLCPECQVKTELKEITIEFERKGIQATMSGIPAMVCPNCSEEYVPGEISGDVIEIVSRAIDQLETPLRRSEARRKELLPEHPAPSPERLELVLAS